MFNSPTQYADQLFDCFMGNAENAQTELFSAARTYPSVPAKFWHDVYKVLGSKRYVGNQIVEA
jgi:hypothetical protein